MNRDVSDWLESLGLSQYSAQFSANDIGMDLLPELTHELLEQIGIKSVGHRLRLLRAVADFHTPHPPDNGALNRVSGSVTPPADAERRQLTVMFCDLVDSTVLSTRLDPEDLRDVVRAYQQAAGQVIKYYDGHIAQYLGDGLLVYFGYPQAHENDAERAVFAGLGVPGAIANLNERLQGQYGVELSVRIGIHTGTVVVGQMGGSARQENLALGETPNLAARIEGLAKPNTVTISDSTRRLLGESFDLEALGPQALKGIVAPMPVFAVRGERLVETRFSAEHHGDTGTIVGRDKDLDVLRRCWQDTLAGEGRMVLLTGEAGIGKSRVVRGLTDSLNDTEYVRLTYQCSPYQTDTALYPAFTQLRRAARIETGDQPDEQLNKLESLLYKGSDDISLAAPLLGLMMGMGDTVQARYGDLGLSPQAQRTQALQVLSDQLLSLTKKRPVLFILEDAHWIDPTTQALTELLLERIAGHRVLFLVTTRPVFEDNYGEHSSLTRIALNRLSREQAAHMISRLAMDKPFPSDLVDEILVKADGVPLFVEEITKTILESGSLIETANAYEVSQTGARLTVPSSLQDSLMARLDKLQSIKVVAQTAACIGRDFSVSLLNALLPMTQNSLAQALNQLVNGELIFAQGEPPQTIYSFKHALVRDAAYESQLRTKRQQVHREILSQLKLTEGAIAPQVLAHHALHAGLVTQAAEYWTKAGDFSFGQPAYLEAISSYERALQALRSDQTLSTSEASQRLELQLTNKLIRALSAGRGLTHADTVAAVDAERRLQAQLGDASRRFEVMFNGINVDIARAKFDKVRAQTDEIVVLADQSEDLILQSVAYRLRAFSTIAAGGFTAALPDYEHALALYHPDQDEETMRRYGINNGIALRCSMSQALAGCGLGGRAALLMDGLEQTARDLNVPATLGFALSNMATTYQIGRWPNAKQFAIQALDVVRNYQLVAWTSSLMCELGAVLYEEGQYDEAADLLRQGIGYRRDNGGLIFLPYHLALLAACLFALNRDDEAQEIEGEVLQMLEHGSEQWTTAECHRLLAQAHHRRDRQNNTAITRLNLAIKIAQCQGAALWEIRAATDLARILSSHSATDEARAMLHPIVLAFPADGHMLVDYLHARKLLDQMDFPS